MGKRDNSWRCIAHETVMDMLNRGEVVVQIGQISDASKRALDKMVRAGTVLKWRGKWFPVAGASFGIGPDKTCWGLASMYGAAS